MILEAYSRQVIGWALDRNIKDELTLTTLRMALSRRGIQQGLVHHADRGRQYASNDYTEGNPWNKAACESFMKTLKYEGSGSDSVTNSLAPGINDLYADDATALYYRDRHRFISCGYVGGWLSFMRKGSNRVPDTIIFVRSAVTRLFRAELGATRL